MRKPHVYLLMWGIITSLVGIWGLWLLPPQPSGEGEQPLSCSPGESGMRAGDFQKGITVVVYWNDEDFKATASGLLDRLAGLGIDHVSLVYPIFQENWRSVEVYADPEQTLSKENIKTFVSEAHRRGFKVMLRPLLDERSLLRDGKWRAEISPTDKAAWFQSYTRLILDYAALAEAEGVEIFSIGAELTSLEGETEQWNKLIASVRQSFSGQITYSSHQDISATAGFWPQLDFIGVDAYPPLDVPVDASVEELVAAWQPVINKMRRSCRALGVPLVFTELGTRSQKGSHLQPWVWDHGTEVDLETQRRYYAASCQAASRLVVGIYWWAVFFNSQGDPHRDPGFNPIGKPAELEIAQCYQELIPDRQQNRMLDSNDASSAGPSGLEIDSQ